MSSVARRPIPGIEAVRQWARSRQLLLDVGLAAAVAVVSCLDALSATGPDTRSVDIAAFALIIAGATALVWRRRYPLSVLVVVATILCVFWARDYGSFQSVLGLPALYAATAHSNQRRRAWTVVTVAIVTMVAVASQSILDTSDGFSWSNAGVMTVYVTAAAALGSIVRNRHRIFIDLEQQARQAETERLAAARQAVARERVRIAREMHDVVAHGMSVITVQAAAAQAVVHMDPHAAAETLSDIETVSRESLNEMRRMLGVLRNDDETEQPKSLEPQPHIDDVQRLVEHCTEAGLPAELTVTGRQRTVAPGLGLAGYRVVQEALTNSLKHAGPPADVVVRINYTNTSIEIDVTNTGNRTPNPFATNGAGHGLIGMRERVEIYNGQFTAEPRPEGGFHVHAVLPTDNKPRRASPSVADHAVERVQ